MRIFTLVFMVLAIACDSRTAPAQPPPPTGADALAVNVDGVADWMSSRAFIDATAYFRRWGMPGEGWKENPKLRLTADNYPLDDADAVSHMRGYPDGIYRLRYEGTATITFSGTARVGPGTVNRNGNVTTADVLFKRGGAEDLITMHVRGVDPANPLKSIQLLAPGYDDAKQVFTNEFIRRVRPFPTIRFMDWQQTNASEHARPPREWAERAKPGMFGRTGVKGVPMEEIVQLANLTKRNVWVNIPQGASADYIKQFATHLRDHLHKDAVIRFEYSNEVWNFGFQQAKDNLFAARENKALSKSDEFGKSAQQAADALGNAARIFKTVFGDEQFEKRVRPVLGGFIASSYWAQTQLEWLKDKHPKLVKDLAIAPYFGVEGDIKDADVPGATADALFDKLNTWIDTKIVEWIGQHAKLAKDHGVALVAYEGGNHLTAGNNINEELKTRMQGMPRMAKTYAHLLDVWQKNGGGVFVQFGHIGPYTKFGSWGLLQSMNDKGSVKWDFFMSRLLPAGDANLDGKVDSADVKIVTENQGLEGKWWEEGDFNGDNKVDDADLKIVTTGVKK